MRQAADKDVYLSPPEVAAMSSTSTSTVRRWIDGGLLPAMRSVGNHRKVRRSDLLVFLRERNLPIPVELGGGKRRLLIIEDDVDFLKGLKSALEARAPGLAIDVATNATHGLILVGVKKPDVVIMDALLEGLDGFEACRFLKSMPETHGIKILGISGDARSEGKFHKVGVDAYLQKPFSTSTVVEMLRLMGMIESRV